MRSSLRSAWTAAHVTGIKGLVAAGLASAFIWSCTGAPPAPSVPPATSPGPTPGPTPALTAASGSSQAPVSTSRTPCEVSVVPEIGAPGGWIVAVGSGFKSGEDVTWTHAAEDGSLAATFDTNDHGPLRPDDRGGFGIALSGIDEALVGHTMNATITSESCTAHATWRIEATNDQTGHADPATEPCSTEHTPADRVDDTDDHQVHLIYAIPADAATSDVDTAPNVDTSIDRVQAFLREHLDGHALRFDTCDGELDITFLQLPLTGREYAAMRYAFIEGLESDLASNGFRQGKKLYVVLWDGLTQWARLDEGCGGEAGNRGVAVFFLRTKIGEKCARLGQAEPIGEPDAGLVHEVIHLLGVPAECAPHIDEIGHVTDGAGDLMDGDGGVAAEIDADHDDYYLHGIAGCPDLANSAFLEPLPDDAELPVGWPSD
jgi:hypothetical protein